MRVLKREKVSGKGFDENLAEALGGLRSELIIEINQVTRSSLASHVRSGPVLHGARATRVSEGRLRPWLGMRKSAEKVTAVCAILREGFSVNLRETGLKRVRTRPDCHLPFKSFLNPNG